MIRPRLKPVLLALTIVTTLLIISVAGAYFSLENKMTKTLEQKGLLQPTQFFADGYRFRQRGYIQPNAVEKLFQDLNYRKRAPDQLLLPGDFAQKSAQECVLQLGDRAPASTSGCFFYVRKDATVDQAPTEIVSIVYDAEGIILALYKGSQAIVESAMEPRLFAQYLGTEPLMQERAPLGQIPTACLNAVISIEDQNFLEHGGYSVTGIARAVFKNLWKGRKAQGGSTITQQLVKNYFLTPEKTISRKVQELFLAIMLESKLTKDEILETYLNEIYLGQNGSFRVHGYGSASRYYFNKPVDGLGLSECALLAAIVNNPRAYNPWRNAAAAKTRRDLVLHKMLELKLISEDDAKTAQNEALPALAPPANATETAPYFIDAARKQMQSLSLPLEGVQVFTTLDLDAQQLAQESLQNHLANLEKNNKHISAIKQKGKSLEGLVLLSDTQTGLVHVAVGGRSYRMTQFNRVTDSRRQVGSVMKPFVYLAALQSKTPEDKPYTPLTLVNDEKTQIVYEGQKWTPENYEKKYEGPVPLFYALKNSLNASTVNLAMAVGLDKVITAAQQMGITSTLKPVPSLALGAFELSPKEVLTAAMTMAQMGQRPQMSFIRRVLDAKGQPLFEHKPAPTPSADPVATASLVSMMKQTLLTGSARSVTLSGFKYPAAGKTGTTNDNKDTWFYGFTPYLACVVWVGYDDNTTTKLTGASGSVPVWLNIMKKAAGAYPPDDFAWPEGTDKVTIDKGELEKLHAYREGDPESLELIFADGTRGWFN